VPLGLFAIQTLVLMTYPTAIGVPLLQSVYRWGNNLLHEPEALIISKEALDLPSPKPSPRLTVSFLTARYSSELME